MDKSPIDKIKYKKVLFKGFKGEKFLPENGGYESGIAGYYVYEYRKENYLCFKVYSLDVWGNKKEGFEVNDRSLSGLIFLPLDATDSEIIIQLKKHGFLNNRIHLKSINILGDDSLHMEIDYKNVPCLQLEVNEV